MGKGIKKMFKKLKKNIEKEKYGKERYRKGKYGKGKIWENRWKKSGDRQIWKKERKINKR